MKEQDSLLSPTNQRRLHELNEYIEVLEAAIDFKNDSIASKQLDVGQIVQSDIVTLSEIKEKFVQLSAEESKVLLARYFDKVVNFRLMESQQEQLQRELQAEVSVQQETVRKLERSLKQAQLDMERRIITQQKVCVVCLATMYYLNLCMHSRTGARTAITVPDATVG